MKFSIMKVLKTVKGMNLLGKYKVMYNILVNIGLKIIKIHFVF